MPASTDAATAETKQQQQQEQDAIMERYRSKTERYKELKRAIQMLGPAPAHELRTVRDTAQEWYEHTSAPPSFVQIFVLGNWAYREGHQGVFDVITARTVEQADMDQAEFFANNLAELVAGVTRQHRGRRIDKKKVDIQVQQKLHARWKKHQKTLRQQRKKKKAAAEATTTTTKQDERSGAAGNNAGDAAGKTSTEQGGDQQAVSGTSPDASTVGV
jgi:hypothetical protein